MTATMRKSLAVILAIAMLLALLPFAMVNAFAENNTAEQVETPVLNETIVGTVTFQSFNFLGDNATGEDGTEYNTTFYYSDDYFSASAINDKVNSKSVTWDKLDNVALATTSMDFTVASMTSSINNVVSPSERTWDNSYYKNENGKGEKFANAYSFLQACGFENLQQDELDEKPTMDSIGSTIGSKTIRVWDEETQTNKEFTLVAVGVRGAGYDSEWASNITIGDPKTNQIPENGRHYGFDSSAQEICRRIKAYNDAHGIDSNVKYWITGFSRAAAVANLAAGYLTDKADEYYTAQKDIYAYTWECPQAASTDENALEYKNIHNIINPMDAVPKVSPDGFQHQRLGVDYAMPFYGNTKTGEENTNYYSRMYEVLKTIATAFDSDGNPDPLINAVNPNNYPYNKAITIYKMDGSDLVWQVIKYGLGTDKETLMKEFGTVEAEQKHKGTHFYDRLITYGNVEELLDYANDGTYKTTTLHIDTFIDSLINVFLTSNAWEGRTGISANPLENRTRFISDYQNDFRILLGYFLDFSGPAFLSILPKLIDTVVDNFGSSIDTGFAGRFYQFYNFNSGKDELIEASKELAVRVADSMTAGFEDPQEITRDEMHSALEHVAELVINLYDFELHSFDSQYLGTTLRYLNTILCTHEQETVLSWIMSLDDNHINRGYRTLTVPKDATVTMHVFRDGIDSEMSATANGPVIAEYEDGKLSSLDQRIYYSLNGSNVTIRYPASLNIRTDVTADKSIANFTYSVRDYQTKTATKAVSAGPEQYKSLNNEDNYTEITTQTNKTNAKNINDHSVTSVLNENNAVQIMAHASTTFDNHAAGDANVYEVKNSPKYKITFKNDDDTVLDEQKVIEGMIPVYQGKEPVKEETLTHQYEFTGWDTEIAAASDDAVYTAQYNEIEKLLTGHSLSLDGNIAVNFYYHVPDRYDGDLDISFNYRNSERQGTLEEVSTGYYNYRATYAVPAKEMTEPITATLSSNGEVVDTHRYTIKRYADLAIANSAVYGEKLVAISKSMVNYGAYAQRFFGYRLDDLADADLTDYSMESTDDLIAPELNKNELDAQISPYGLSYYGLTLVLESETTLKLYFLKESDFDTSVRVYVNGKETEFKEETISGLDGDYLSVSIPNIAAKNIGNKYTVKIGDASFKVSPLNYIQEALNTNNASLKNLVTALYDYYKTAKTYFS